MEVMQKEDSTKDEFREVLESAIRRLERMPPEEKANWSKLIYFLLAFIKYRRDATEHPELFRVVKSNVADRIRREEVETMGKTMAQVLIEEGEAKGKAEGRVESLIRLLQIRFGQVPEEFIVRINSINQIDQLNEIFDFAVIAKTADDVRKKLIELNN